LRSGPGLWPRPRPRAWEIAGALERLVAPEQMGTLFKVLGLAGKDWPVGAGF
jgi:NADH dehydrogenase [ubiquinone] 1 alpha subcomplex assembly factor 7